MSRLLPAFLCTALAAFSWALCAAAVPRGEASVGTDGLHLKPITSGPHAGKKHAEQAFTFALGKRLYRLRYVAAVDPAQPGKAFPAEGYLGMPAPCSCNWYHGGFLFVRVNGRDVGEASLHAGLVAETGSRAIADLVWDAEPARVRVRFAGLPDDDKLLCEIALEPKEEVKDLRVLLRCYPSFFTAWHRRAGDRKVATPAGTLDQGQRVELPAAQHGYAVYYDTVFDVARGEGEGPCAALFGRGAIRAVKFDVGSYAVGTELVCRPDARSVRLAFWDMPNVANEAALASFRRSARTWADELHAFDFTPAAVRGFEPEAELATLGQLTRAPEVRTALGAKAEAYRKQIEALASRSGTLGILDENRLLGFLSGYREFLWELKLAALLAD